MARVGAGPERPWSLPIQYFPASRPEIPFRLRRDRDRGTMGSHCLDAGLPKMVAIHATTRAMSSGRAP